MKIFLDTNIILRFYLAGDKKQFIDVSQLIAKIESGHHRSYMSSIILLEIAYVLEKIYRMPRREIIKIISSVQKIRGLTIINQTNSKVALRFFQQHDIKLADCFIASQISKDMTLVTYDQDFSKLPVKTINPDKISA